VRGDVEAVGGEALGFGRKLLLVEVGDDKSSAVTKAAGTGHAHSPNARDHDDVHLYFFAATVIGRARRESGTGVTTTSAAASS